MSLRPEGTATAAGHVMQTVRFRQAHLTALLSVDYRYPPSHL